MRTRTGGRDASARPGLVTRPIALALSLAMLGVMVVGAAAASGQDWSPEARSHLSPPLTPPIAPSGTIVIHKDAIPDSPELFDFFGPFGPFEMGDDGAGILHNEQRFVNLAPGSYFFEEFTSADWIVDVACDDPDASTFTFFDAAFGSGAFVEVFLDPGEIVNCTFTNSRTGNIVVEKDTVPAGSTQAFGFLPSYGLPFNLAGGESHDSGPVAPGTYSIVEPVAPGWQLESATCDDGSDPSAIELDATEMVTCTFVNRQLGTVVIEKNAVPDDPQVFDFIGDLGAFSLADDPASPVPAATTFSVEAGSYTVVERAIAGWDLTALSCSDPDGGTTASTATRSATLDVDPGETVTCTYTNERIPGTIIIVKETPAPAMVEFDFTEARSKVPAFSLDTSPATVISNTKILSGLDQGTYTIQETATPRWRLASINCQDPDRGSVPVLDLHTAVIDLDWGETVTCTFANEPVAYQVGLHDPTAGSWSLSLSDTLTQTFSFGNAGDVGFVGDWDCDGLETPGVWRPSNQTVYLRNSNNTGIADISYPLGNPGDIPFAGDFDGDGCDTVGVYRDGKVIISNNLGPAGPTDPTYTYGNPSDLDIVTGDWDGDGVETIGIYRDGLVLLRNGHSAGGADVVFALGNPEDRFLVAGDWNADDAVSTAGLFRPEVATYYLRNSNTSGVGDEQFGFGHPDSLRPVAGRFRPLFL